MSHLAQLLHDKAIINNAWHEKQQYGMSNRAAIMHDNAIIINALHNELQ